MVMVIMTTFNPTPDAPRHEYAVQCVEALRGNLATSERLDLVLADDGSTDVKMLHAIRGFWDRGHSAVLSGPNAGIGASLNRALRYTPAYRPWLYTTDDWLLRAPLDLKLPLWLLEQGYDLVRLGPIHPNLSCTTKFTAGRGWWLELNLHHPDGGFHFATRPFIARQSLIDKVGPFDEGLNAYETERLYAERCNNAWWDLKFAAVNLAGPWEHIGEYEVGEITPAFSNEKGEHHA